MYTGLDVGARSVEVVLRVNGKNSKAESFEQSAQGHARLIKRLTGFKPVSILMEATGIYYLDLALALHEAGLPVCVINPKSYHHFAKLKLNQSKTDAQDAGLLAEYAQRMTPSLWTPPEPTRMMLRDLGRQINRLTGARSQAKNRLHALQSKQMTMRLLLEDEVEGIALLDRRIERLQQAALELIAKEPVLTRQFAHMCSAKGIGKASAIALLGELGVLSHALKAPQVSRYAGLDVRLTQSGSSVNSPARLSKAGNAYLRAALFMPAMSALQHDARAKAFYTALLARGKKKCRPCAR